MSKQCPSSVQAVSKQCPNSVQAVSKQCPNSVQTVSKQCPNSVQTVSKQCLNSVQIMSKQCPNSVQTVSKQCPNSVQTMSKQCTNSVQTVSKHCPNSVRTTCLNSFRIILKMSSNELFSSSVTLPNYADTPIRHKIKGTRDFTVKMLCGKVSGRIAEYRHSLPTIEHEAEAMHVPQVRLRLCTFHR